MHFSFRRNSFLLFEGKKHSENDKDESDDVVPAESLGLENGNHDDGKHGQRDGFLYDFQLNKVERTSVLHGTDAIGWNHEGIFKQGNAPWHQDDENERPILGTGDNLKQFELPVPSEGHENIGDDK